MFVREIVLVLLVFDAREDGKIDSKASQMIPYVLDENVASFHVSVKHNDSVVMFHRSIEI